MGCAPTARSATSTATTPPPTVDGPGFRYVVWLMGCHIRCQYCHNPDTWSLPPAGASQTPDDVLADVARFGDFLRASGGGFTVSGGEPLVQAPFAMRLIRGARRLGLHTALDTNGFLGDSLTVSDLAEIDLVLLDLKAFDDRHHHRVAGVSNRPILAFAERLASLGRPVWARFVLVPGLTDGVDDLRALADYIATLGNVERVEVLPFHQMGRNKWRGLGLNYPLAETPAAAPEQVAAAEAIFRDAGCRLLAS